MEKAAAAGDRNSSALSSLRSSRSFITDTNPSPEPARLVRALKLTELSRGSQQP